MTFHLIDQADPTAGNYHIFRHNLSHPERWRANGIPFVTPYVRSVCMQNVTHSGYHEQPLGHHRCHLLLHNVISIGRFLYKTDIILSINNGCYDE